MGAIRYEKNGELAYITIEGDGPLNPITSTMETEFADSLEAYRDDRNLRVAIITGAGNRSFSVGGDLKALRAGEDAKWFTPKTMRERYWWPRDTGYAGGLRLVTLKIDKPVIAAVNGYCMGIAFMFLVQGTDIRIAAEHAQFGLSETRRGLPSGAAASELARHIPFPLAMHMILTGKTIDAQKALQVGLINEVVPIAELMPTAERIAKDICEIPPLVVKAEKEGALNSLNWPRRATARYAWMIECMYLQEPEAMDEVKSFFQGRR